MPMVGPAAVFEDAGVKRLDKFPDAFETIGDGALGQMRALGLKHLQRAMQWYLEPILLFENPNPELRREFAFGDKFGGNRRRDDARHAWAFAGTAIPLAAVDLAPQDYFPMSFLTILRTWKIIEWQSAYLTIALQFRDIMKNLFGGQFRVRPASSAFPSTLLPTLATAAMGGLA